MQPEKKKKLIQNKNHSRVSNSIKALQTQFHNRSSSSSSRSTSASISTLEGEKEKEYGDVRRYTAPAPVLRFSRVTTHETRQGLAVRDVSTSCSFDRFVLRLGELVETWSC